MALAGSGAICIWNDITADARADFYAWHLEEHIAERLAIPGFLRARRYCALAAGTGPEFFTLYETATSSVTTSAAYVTRLNAPSAWTTRLTPAFSHTSRAVAEVASSHGVGPGGFLATLRITLSTAAKRKAVTAWLTREKALPAWAKKPMITGAHFCLTDLQGSGIQTTESRARGGGLVAPDGVILIEGCELKAVATMARDVVAGVFAHLAMPPALDIYHLEHIRSAVLPTATPASHS